MNKFALAVCALAVLATPSFAQSDDAGAGAKGGKMKEAVKACRTAAKAQGLEGHDLHQSIADCVSKDHPGMASMMKCRVEAMDKGLKKGSDEFKSYIKTCKQHA